jgi:hypothetical protein
MLALTHVASLLSTEGANYGTGIDDLERIQSATNLVYPAKNLSRSK